MRDDNTKRDIWRYLDGEMSEEEILAFKEVFGTDPLLAEELRTSELLHHDLEKIYNHRAPARVLLRVLDKVDDIRILERSAVRSIAIIFVLMIMAGLTTLLLPYGDSASAGYLDLSWATGMVSSQGFNLFAISSVVIFGFLLLDHFLLSPRVPR